MLLNICPLKTSEQSEETVKSSSTLSYKEAKSIDGKLTRLLGLKVWFLNCRCISITWYLARNAYSQAPSQNQKFQGLSNLCFNRPFQGLECLLNLSSTDLKHIKEQISQIFNFNFCSQHFMRTRFLLTSTRKHQVNNKVSCDKFLTNLKVRKKCAFLKCFSTLQLYPTNK